VLEVFAQVTAEVVEVVLVVEVAVEVLVVEVVVVGSQITHSLHTEIKAHA
jgi:hypothetical protein